VYISGKMSKQVSHIKVPMKIDYMVANAGHNTNNWSRRCDCSWCLNDPKKDDTYLANLFCDEGCTCAWCVQRPIKCFSDAQTQTEANNFIIVEGKMYLLIETFVI